MKPLLVIFLTSWCFIGHILHSAGVYAEAKAVENEWKQFSAHRLLRYEVNDAQYGSWKSSMKGAVSSIKELDTFKNKRAICLLRIDDLTNDTLQYTPRMSGAVILLPKDLYGSLKQSFLDHRNEEQLDGSDIEAADEYVQKRLEQLKSFEYELLHRKLMLPVYFTWESSNLLQLYYSLKNDTKKALTEPKINFSVNLKEPTKLSVLEGVNFIGSLSSRSNTGRNQNEPTIAIVTHYDAFSSVPGLTIGAENGGSGLIGLMEMIRIFSELYKSGYNSNYRLIFILSDAASSEFYGIEQWLSKADPLLLDSIEFAICLDAIGGKSLKLHLSRNPRNERAKELIERFKGIFEHNGEQFEILTKKVKRNDPEVPWQHEQFTKHKVFGGTISHLTAAASVSKRGTVFDYTFNPDNKLRLLKQIQLISESLAHHIFDLPETEIEMIPGLISKEHVNGWEKAILSSTRFHPRMEKRDPFRLELEAQFNKYFPHPEKMEFKITDTPARHYKDQEVAILVTRVNKPILDAIHLLLNLIYLLIIYYIVNRGDLSSLKKTFNSPATKKKKKAQ